MSSWRLSNVSSSVSPERSLPLPKSQKQYRSGCHRVLHESCWMVTVFRPSLLSLKFLKLSVNMNMYRYHQTLPYILSRPMYPLIIVVDYYLPLYLFFLIDSWLWVCLLHYFSFVDSCHLDIEQGCIFSSFLSHFRIFFGTWTLSSLP